MLNLMTCSLLLLGALYIYFFSIKYRFLSALLVLEAMVLLLLIFTVALTFTMLDSLSLYFFVLTLSVSEAALGLALLISFGKFKGNDLLNSKMYNF
uniref:NADH dehydrogenase subunit 4L n=1 Tax=Zaptyx yaeyamensis TaxID=1885892 RepID=A0A224ACQ7_9EUPU|nr:NADH dehydrogenase subunit 4L [Zaptyx yaeyamensis]